MRSWVDEANPAYELLVGVRTQASRRIDRAQRYLSRALSFLMKVCNQLRQLIIFGIEVRGRQVEGFGHVPEGLIVGLVDTRFVAVDSRTGDELINAGFDAQVALG